MKKLLMSFTTRLPIVRSLFASIFVLCCSVVFAAAPPDDNGGVTGGGGLNGENSGTPNGKATAGPGTPNLQVRCVTATGGVDMKLRIFAN